jgi:uncharacterized cupin superfamily protein
MDPTSAMTMTLMKAAAKLASAELADWGPVGLPEGRPIAHLRGREIAASPDKRVESGIWECSPGIWRRQVKKAEFCHFVSGRCSFTHDDGRRIEIAAGDSVFFPANTNGIWDVKETVRKVFVVFEL